jgi:predicted CopG family antitoxin
MTTTSESRPEGLQSLACNLVKMSRADKRIPVREETFEKLGDLKGAGDTWDDVMQDLIEAQQKQNRRDLLERTDDDDFVPLDEV